MRKFALLILIILLLVITSCSVNPFMDLENIQEAFEIEKIPSQEDYPDADAVIVLELHNVYMNINENYGIDTYETVHIVKKLFKNIDDYASIEIPIFEGEKLTEIYARTVKPDGSSVSLKKDEFYTISGKGDGSIFYSDIQTKRFTFPAIEKDCLIEYKYEKRKKYPFRYDKWNIQHSIPTLINSYSLTVPRVLMERADWSWRYKTYNYPSIGKPVVTDPEPLERSRISKKVNFNWLLRDIPAFEPEPMMPPYSRFLYYVKFAPSEWKEWNDISKWYYKEIFEPQLILTDQIKGLAKELTQSCYDDKEKVKKVFDYIQKIRYVAIQLGIGGIQPSEPQTVFDRQYGDCKDKSMLLISLLRSLGITAKPVLVLTAPDGIIDPKFPCWIFNHMIVKVETSEGREFWIDPTVKFCPLGELPWTDEGIDVLVINEDGTSKIEKTPYSSYKDNVMDIAVIVNIKSEKEVTFSVKVKYKGEENFQNRNYFEDHTNKEMKEFCKSIIIDDFLNATILNYSFSKLDSLDNDLVFDFEFTVPNAIQKQGDLLFLNTNPFKLIDNMGWLLKETRKYPIEFHYPLTKKIQFVVNYPENLFTIRNIPDNSQMSAKDLSYSREVLPTKSDQITFNQTFEIRNLFLSSKNYPDVRSFFESVQNDLNQKLIFTEK